METVSKSAAAPGSRRSTQPFFLLLASLLCAVHGFVSWRFGWSESGLLTLLRSTARTSAILFLAAFVARPWCRLSAGRSARELLRRRREVGLAMAVSHGIHLAAIVGYFRQSAGPRPDLVTLLVGGGAYVLLGLMALTSTRRARQALGRWWRRLHLLGMWWLWFVLLATFAGNASTRWSSALFSALLLGAALLRLVVRLRR